MKFEISKSTVQCSHEDDYVSICVEDPVSRIRFLDLKITFEAFGRLMANSGTVECEGTLTGTTQVGKVKVREKRQARLPAELSYNRGNAEAWLLANCKEEGWTIDPYLGSQGSMIHAGNQMILANYAVYKYVNAPE